MGARLTYGAVAPIWTSLLTSAVLLTGGVAIWLGFFPPAWYQTRVQRALGAS